MIKWINKELGEYGILDLTKVAIDLFIKNMEVSKFTKVEKEDIAKYFSREILEEGRETRGYTS